VGVFHEPTKMRGIRAIVRYYFSILESAMIKANIPSSIKVIGANGQISLGKQYAGRQVLVEEQEQGVWLIRTATVIPDNERWLQQPQSADDLQAALAWAQTHPASDAGTDTLLGRLSEER
jgi:hypothetical protein